MTKRPTHRIFTTDAREARVGRRISARESIKKIAGAQNSKRKTKRKK